MIIECPSCKYSAETDAAKIPPGGTQAKCPMCNHRFFVRKEAPVITDTPVNRSMINNGVPTDETVANHPDIETISGPTASAIKRKGNRLWTIVPAQDMPDNATSLGLMLLIAKDNKERAGDPATTKSSISLGFPFISQIVPPWLTPLILVAAALVTASGYFFGYGLTAVFSRTVLVTWLDLILAMGTVLMTIAGMTMCEAAATGSHIQTRAPFWGFKAGLIHVEPVVWRLGIPLETALHVISLAFFLILSTFGWFLLSPPLFMGIMTGAFLYLVTALYPLEPGPGSKCLETLTGSPDIANQLQWIIISRFMALRLKSEAASGRAMIPAAFFLSCWVAFAGGTLYFLTSDMFAHGSIAGVLWRAFFSLLGLGYTLWLIVRTGLMIHTASQLTEKTKLSPVTPSADILDYWKNYNAIIAHIPRLRDASWRWASVSAGSFLIRHGSDDSQFYWLASGRAAVFARDKNGDSIHVATLGAGTGVGEIALLENIKRTADVVIEQTAVIALLDRNEFMKCTTEDDRIRFRQVVMAGQALAKSRVFYGLPRQDRERWIASGKPKYYAMDETIITEGSTEKWIGLVVSGKIEVLKNGEQIANLDPDTVIGEMAYLEDRPRTATLKAQEGTLLWHWEPEWLNSNLDKSDLLDSLSALARERGRS